jgi:hypothetical protein
MFRNDKNDNQPYRVAFSDIDGTLLIKDAEGRHVLNPAVIEKLSEYDEVDLFTQRGKFVLLDKQSEVPYGEQFTPKVEAEIDHAQIAYVLDELKKALPGKIIKVSTSLDPFFNRGEVGAYYDQQVHAYEAKLAEAAKAKCMSLDGTGRQLLAPEALKALEHDLKTEAENEIADILKNPDMLKKCYEQLKQRMDPTNKENVSFGKKSGYERIMGVMNRYLIENAVLPDDEVDLKTDEAREVFYNFLLSLEGEGDLLRPLLERLIKDKLFLSPLQDKMGHYDSASRQIQEQHPDRKVEFTIFEDAGLNLAEIDLMDFGDRQPVGVLVVEGLGVNTSSAHVKHLTKSEIDERAVQRAAMSKEERQQIASAVLRESKGRDPLPSKETLTNTFSEVSRLLTGGALLTKLDKGHLGGGTKIKVDDQTYRVSKNLADVIQVMMKGMDAVGGLQKKPEAKSKAEWSCLCEAHQVSKNWLETLSSQRLKGVDFKNASPEAIARTILSGDFDGKYKLHAQLFLMLNPLAKGQLNGMDYNFIEMQKQLQVFQQSFGGVAPLLDPPMKEASSATAKMMKVFAGKTPVQAPKPPTQHDAALSGFYETLAGQLQNAEFFKKLETKRLASGKSVKVGGESKRISDTLADMILLLQANKGVMDGAKKAEIVKEIFNKSREWLQDNAPDILKGKRPSSDPLLVAENIIQHVKKGEEVREEHVMHAAIFHVLQPKLEPRDNNVGKQSSERSLKEAFNSLCDPSARSTYDANKRFSGSLEPPPVENTPKIITPPTGFDRAPPSPRTRK